MDRVNPSDIATPLFMEYLLTKQELTYATQQALTKGEQLQEIYDVLESRVSVNPQHFHTLVEIPALKDVGDHMKGL